jgi:hypothetical protein
MPTDSVSSLDEAEVSVLSEVYAKQYVRSSGALASDFNDPVKQNYLLRLRERGLVSLGKFYRFDTLRCSDSGHGIAAKRLAGYFEALQLEFKTKLRRIPSKVYRFLVFDCIGSGSTWPAQKQSYYLFDWRQFPFSDSRVQEFTAKFFSILEEESETIPILGKTLNYVSTRGGEIRDVEYVFPPETMSALQAVSEVRSGLSLDDSRLFRIVQFFSNVAPYLTKNGLPVKGSTDVREFVWQRLTSLDLREEDIIPLVSELSRNKVCSPWSGLYASRVPFTIDDPTGLKIYLSNNIAKRAVDGLLARQDGATMEWEDRKDQPQLVVTADSEFRRETELFREIAMLEFALRELIETRLTKAFGNKWDEVLPTSISASWAERKKNDLRDSFEPEENIINYADLLDYGEILTCSKFRSIFQDMFADAEKTKVALRDINSGRNRVMHHRTITDQVYVVTYHNLNWIKSRLSTN